MKLSLIVLLTVGCVGCATQDMLPKGSTQVLSGAEEVQPKPLTRIPSGTESLLEKAYRLIEAYDKNDSKTWSELMCTTVENEKVFGLSANKFLGEFSSPRLVSISSITDAGNSMGQFRWPKVAIEVQATGYPVGKLLLKFVEEKDGKCVGLIY